MTEDLGQTVTEDDAEFMLRVAEHGRPMYLKGPELSRARRLAKLGLMAKGRLGEQYYDVSDPAGATFVANVRRHREAG